MFIVQVSNILQILSPHSQINVRSLEYLFICGFGSVGIFSLVAGLVNDKIGLIVLRAIIGLCEHFLLILHLQHSDIASTVAALSIPSALSLVVHLFPDPNEQGYALTLFAGGGPIGNSELSFMQ
jgi:hypothetical protein